MKYLTGWLEWRNVSGFLALALPALGCSLEEVDSDAIRTQGMYAEVVAVAPGDSTTLVRVELTVGGDNGTTVNLVGDDRLVAMVGDVPGELSRSGAGRYEQRLSGESASEVTIELQRGPDDDAAICRATMPEPFAMSLQTDARAGIARSDAVSFTWDEGGDRIEWSVEGRCIWSESGETFDDGLFTLEPEVFRVRGTRQGEDCEVSVTLDRVQRGVVDPGFVPGSSFRAIQRRRVTFISTPGVDEEGYLPVEPEPG